VAVFVEFVYGRYVMQTAEAKCLAEENRGNFLFRLFNMFFQLEMKGLLRL
jgi:hypothetical protein